MGAILIAHKDQEAGTMTELKLRCSGGGRAPTGRDQRAK